MAFRDDFFNFLKKNIGGLPVEEQEDLLDDLFKLREEYLDKIKSNKRYCPYCEKYLREDEFQIRYETKSVYEATYIDAGYGDDDEYGDVEYTFKIYKCPRCKKEEEKKHRYIRTISSKKIR